MSAQPDRAHSDVEALLVPWAGPYGGTPPFDKSTAESVGRAYETAMERKRVEIRAIAANTAPASFANTVIPLEDAGRELQRVDCLFRVLAATASTEGVRRLEARIAPLLPNLEDEIAHDDALFARVARVAETGQAAGLATHEQRLAAVIEHRLRRRGAGLPMGAKRRLAAIHGRLAELYTAFGQHLLVEQEEQALILQREADLEGLQGSLRRGAAMAATALGHPGKWAIPNERASVLAFLTHSAHRDSREKAWRMWVMRGANDGPADNRPLVREILRLRGEKAKLFGSRSYAHWALADRMAATPERARELLMRVWTAAAAAAKEQLAALQALADEEGGGARIAPWDRLYYMEKLRRARFDFNDETLRQHLELENLRAGMFWAAEKLHGLSFRERRDVPGAHADVRVFEVSRAGAPIGALWLDLFNRAGKRSGGWTMPYRGAESFRGRHLPLVSINTNFTRPAAGAPALLSWEEAAVLFHELGHALHGLLSEVRYPSFSWMEVPWDFIELPSRLNERWLETPEVLARFALHARTREPLPPALARRLKTARTFDRMEILEYLATALVDLDLHVSADGGDFDPIAHEARVLADLGMPAAVTPRHRVTHLQHCFCEERYAAGYYVYLWSDAMAADAAEAFAASPGRFYDPVMAERLRSAVLAAGNSVPAAEAFRNFRGRDPDPDALMRWLNLNAAAASGRSQ